MSKYTYEKNEKGRTGIIRTRRGPIYTPTFFPVTTFGDKFPLDRLVRPYLKRLSQCVMVSYYYAQMMTERMDMPMFIDSGGFASLFEGSEIIDHGRYASIITKEEEEIHPLRVLEFQEENADLAATLDFIIPPGMDKTEAKRRQKLTIKNAFYALEEKRDKDLILYASLQCWDKRSARSCARKYAKAGFDGIAIGGLVPRVRDTEYIKKIVSAVREEAPDLPIHVFGIGKPEVLKMLWEMGVDSSDSSSYVRDAVGIQSSSKHVELNKVPVAGIFASLSAALKNLRKVNNYY